MKPIVVALTCASLGISMAQARSATSTGHITFSGAIVEDACHIKQQQDRVQVTCLSGPQQTTDTLNLRQLAQQSPQRLATNQVSYRWIDSRQTMAIITISYE
ncbi:MULTISPECIES: type 1 fimbrial protein [Aeromonas]|jgi:type 1 fimbria pilin|uniref:Type 1 fimbrial protein n=1 Tax=Aeromonas caviae TaxID=648 RepID=A0AAF0GD66_AERCA|nr:MULTISPECIES: type 1 fimbrial protein [Aeromonas]MDU7309966.1 type 1 fimbrial protein [Aeromonas sp.]MBL0536872.1 type 1 fimbrial protein [Aeromonas caviae]MBL0556796.1 type 1 fimbrial protein [Aeromonas caviae]MBL0581987.1 type 1 fimbrial protein [Aeromonas caviae]MCU7791696.1 type 1 fimbrial protein [Aeromonas caviae]